MVPRYTRPLLVMIEHVSPSTLFHVRPPILLSRNRPAAPSISLTIAPSVSTCAVSARPRVLDLPCHVAINPPLLLKRVSSFRAASASRTRCRAFIVYPVGLG